MSFSKTKLLLAASLAFTPLASANSIDVEFELPAFDVDDYQRPYVAIWAENGRDAKHLLVWHLHERAEDKWLPDIRRWWRKIGRFGAHVDGLTGATQGPGTYKQTLDVTGLEEFTLYVEVIREYYESDRALLKTDINFNDATNSYTIPGAQEISDVTVTLNPAK